MSRRKNKRIVVSQFGGPEVLRVTEEDLPEPGLKEVRIKILTAGVAWGDVLKRSRYSLGRRPPFTPGYDLVGRIDKVGSQVSSFNLGQMVAAFPLFGGYTEHICLSETEVIPVPPGIDPAKAVCLIMNYIVAYQLLHRAAHVTPGERILIHGAAGGVGTALVQMGLLHNLELYGTASKAKHGFLSQFPLVPIDYKTEDFRGRIKSLTGDGVDVVFDPIGGNQVRKSYQSLRPGGRLVLYGVHNILAEGMYGSISPMIFSAFKNCIPDGRSLQLYNVMRPKYSKRVWCREDLAKIFGLYREGEIDPVIAECIPLSEASRAHKLLESGQTIGKIVLTAGGS